MAFLGKTEGKLFDIANGRLNPALLGLLLLFAGKLLIAVVTAAFVLLFDDDRDPLSALFDSGCLLVLLPDKCRLAMLVMGR